MKITKIIQQQKRRDRYSVYVDGAFSFGLSEAALIGSRISRGLELDNAELERLQRLSADDKAYSRALRYAALRPRSEWQIRDYLRRKDTSGEQADQVLEKLRQVGLADDAAFAHSWVANRRLLKPVSRRRLEQELRQKHLADTYIRQALQADPSNETDELRTLIKRKQRQTRYSVDQAKLTQYLARQGFTYDDIKSVLAEEAAGSDL